ncbi:MAG TPA: alkaline phosphatase family protein, partial [Terriglobales bacterium]|nr:alkaline phosphatase family protein [Terriglobales bacterium]
FYDWKDLPYHYWLATQFATSDRWFAPGPMETEPNKMYLVAATSVGHVHKPTSSVNVPTIFSLLDAANVSWKVYYSSQPSDAILNFFQPFATQRAANIVPISQYFTDLQNGTLPSVAMIEPPFDGGQDEHPGVGNNIQQGVALTKQYIDALMDSSSWKDSAFILTFDESGGLYDHVPPPTAGVPNPDGIAPQDLITQPPADPAGDFTRYGFRVPVMVVSPFTRKNYVSHTVTDSTAILRMIELRFGLPNLTKRDAVAMDMSEFFDFTNKPWATPPAAASRPSQPTDGACYDGLP